jgi:hypothetical protein
VHSESIPIGGEVMTVPPFCVHVQNLGGGVALKEHDDMGLGLHNTVGWTEALYERDWERRHGRGERKTMRTLNTSLGCTHSKYLRNIPIGGIFLSINASEKICCGRAKKVGTHSSCNIRTNNMHTMYI